MKGVMIRVQAPAKINFNLRITGRRPDGYHFICSLMQTVDLCDVLLLERLPDGQVDLELAGRADNIPTDESNLVVRAVRLVQREIARSKSTDDSEHGNAAAAAIRRHGLPGCRIILEKRIPAGAGLGGGSSDAAAVLIGMNELWQLDLPRETLIRLAAQLGADVPFFIEGGTALVQGIGERITRQPPLPHFDLTLCIPPFAISTAEVYHAYDRLARGSVAEASAAEQQTLRLVDALRGNKWEQAAHDAINDLQEPAVQLYPDLRRVMSWFEQQPCPLFAMTGSGSAFFGIGTGTRNDHLPDHRLIRVTTRPYGVRIQ